MPFRCPQCRTPDSLEIDLAIELPPDRRVGELALQVVSCRVCAFRCLAVYEEERRGSLDAEDWCHTGYWVSADAVQSVTAAILSCPNPRNPDCDCPAHTSLGRQDLHGQWRGLLELERGHTFMMRMYLG